MAGTVVELRAVGKHYGGEEGASTRVVLERVDLIIRAGESLAIVGPSGAGKSTLLNLIGGLDQPSVGQVLVEARDLTVLSEQELASLRNRRIGFIFQDHHLLPQCTVLENILLPVLAAGRPDAGHRARALDLLARVGLGGRDGAFPRVLSGGERQRVAVVRALIMQPAIVLADEPTGALDQSNARGLSNLLAELNREEGVTLLVVTHQPDLAERAGRVLTLIDGRFTERAGTGV